MEYIDAEFLANIFIEKIEHLANEAYVNNKEYFDLHYSMTQDIKAPILMSLILHQVNCHELHLIFGGILLQVKQLLWYSIRVMKVKSDLDLILWKIIF